MKTPKKIKKAIAKKFKIWKDTTALRETAMQELSVSSGRELSAGPDKPLDDIETTLKQQPFFPTATTDAAINVETTIAELCDNDITTIGDQDTSPIAKTLNASDSLSLANPCFDSRSGKGDSIGKKSSNRPIIAGIIGAVLLIGSIVSYIMKMPVIASLVGIAGLACIGFTLYSLFKPNTKLEKVESIEQPNPTLPHYHLHYLGS